jgi:hypothetical protein
MKAKKSANATTRALTTRDQRPMAGPDSPGP